MPPVIIPGDRGRLITLFYVMLRDDVVTAEQITSIVEKHLRPSWVYELDGSDPRMQLAEELSHHILIESKKP